MSISVMIRKVVLGFFLRCPNCEQGRVFQSWFAINETCPNCGVRFERRAGESIGGLMVPALLTPVVVLVGYFVIESIWHPPLLPHLLGWGVFIVLFSVLTYRNFRSLWVAVSWLSGDVYADKPEGNSDPK